MDNFTKRILGLPIIKPFKEGLFFPQMLFRETKKIEQDTERIFHEVRKKMNQKITLKK